MRRRRRIQKGSRRPSQPEQRPHFFKIIFEATLESGELMIPKEFTRQFAKRIDDVAVLKVPSGRKWQVEVKKVGGSVRFQSGWRGFLKYHSVSVGHFLVFRYDGNSNFSVFIFNQSACEIHYPSDSEDDLEESNLHTECLFPLKKEPEEEDPMEPLDACIPSQLLLSSTEKVLDKAQEQQTFKRRRPIRTSSARKQRINRNYQELRELGGDENRPNGGKGKGTNENDIEVIEVPSDNPINETSMSTSRETLSYKMDDDARYPNPEAENALVLVPPTSGGDVCPQFNRNELSASATHGVESNCLELSTGNSTPTTKPNAEKNLDPSFMKNDVYIPPSERDKKIKKVVAARKKLVTKTQREKAISAAQMFKTQNPSFVIIMKPSYVYKGMALHLPRCIADEYLQLKKGVHDVKLSVSNGGTWMVRCIINQCRGGTLSGGWSKFVQDNKLEEGDCCVFEVFKAEGMELKIFIFRVVEKMQNQSQNIINRTYYE